MLLRFAQIGVVSKGHECAHPDYPGIYTRVTAVMSWIKSIALDSLDTNCESPRKGQIFMTQQHKAFSHHVTHSQQWSTL